MESKHILLSNVQKERETLLNKIITLERERDALAKALEEDVGAISATTTTDIAHIQSERDTLHQRVEQLTPRVMSLEHEKDELLATITSLKQQLASSRAASPNVELMSELTSLRTASTQHSHELDTLRHEMATQLNEMMMKHTREREG